MRSGGNTPCHSPCNHLFQVVEIALEETGRSPTKINLAPLVTMMCLIREVTLSTPVTDYAL